MKTFETISILLLLLATLCLGACGGNSSEPGNDIAGDLLPLDSTEPADNTGPLDVQDLNQPEDIPADPADLEPELQDVAPELVDTPYPELTGEPGIIFNLQAEPADLPFPWNWYLVPAQTPTGSRVDLSGPKNVSALLEPMFSLFSKYKTHLELMDGFGSVAQITLSLNTDLNPGDLPQATGPGELIQVFEIPGEGEPMSLPFRLSWNTYNNQQGQLVRRTIELNPVYPLKEATDYLVVVKKGLKNAEGTDLAPFPMAEVMLGRRDPYGPIELAVRMAELRDQTLAAADRLAGQLSVDEIDVAVLYTTGTITRTLFLAAEEVLAQDIEWNLDPENDGVDNIFPASEFSGFTSSPQVAFVLQGRFAAPYFKDEDGVFQLDETGKPLQTGTQWRNFFFVVPSDNSVAPFPVANVQHGLDSHKEAMYGIAKEYANRGIASGGFDFIHHETGESGGLRYLQIDSPREIVDNFRQSALDILAFHKVLKSLAAELDLVPVGGDGILDLNINRIALSGHSLGAINSSLACVISPDERAGGYINGGGNFFHMIYVSLEKTGLFNMMPGDAWAAFKALFGHLTSPGDPVAYAPYAVLEPLEGKGRCPFLLEVSLSDTTVPPESGYELALAARAPQILPFEEQWDWMEAVEPGDSDYGVIQFPGEHSMFFGSDGPEVKARAQAVFFDYIESFLKTGAPLINWPVTL